MASSTVHNVVNSLKQKIFWKYEPKLTFHYFSITGAGDLSIWDFSGYEPYFSVYDHFIGDPNCIHMVVFSLVDPQNVKLDQVTFWLNFLKARIPPFEPIGKHKIKSEVDIPCVLYIWCTCKM